MLAFFSGIGTVELLVILGVALIVLGPTKLPEVAKSVAKGLRDLRRASDDLKRSVYTEVKEVRGTLDEARKDVVARVAEEAKRLEDEIDAEEKEESKEGAEATPPAPGEPEGRG